MLDNGFKTGRLVGIFLLGFWLFSFPILTIFNIDAKAFGITVFYLYLFCAWIILVGLMALVSRLRPAPFFGLPSSSESKAEETSSECISPPGDA